MAEISENRVNVLDTQTFFQTSVWWCFTLFENIYITLFQKQVKVFVAFLVDDDVPESLEIFNVPHIFARVALSRRRTPSSKLSHWVGYF